MKSSASFGALEVPRTGVAKASRLPANGVKSRPLPAYSQAGYPASSVELVEATGRPPRLETQRNFPPFLACGPVSRDWKRRRRVHQVPNRAPQGCGGIAGIMKSVMALHHRTIPPSANFESRTRRSTGPTFRFSCPQHLLNGLVHLHIHAVLACPHSDLVAQISTSHSRAMSPITTYPWLRIGMHAGQPTADKRPPQHPPFSTVPFLQPCLMKR